MTYRNEKEGWVSDAQRSHCVVCHRKFGFITPRRHHCRCCGDVVCHDCSNYSSNDIPHLVPASRGAARPSVRVCRRCLYNRIGVMVLWWSLGWRHEIHGSLHAAKTHFDELLKKAGTSALVIKLAEGDVMYERFTGDIGPRMTAEAHRLRRNFMDPVRSDPSLRVATGGGTGRGPTGTAGGTSLTAPGATPSRNRQAPVMPIVREMLAVLTLGGPSDGRVTWHHDPRVSGTAGDASVGRAASTEDINERSVRSFAGSEPSANTERDLKELLQGRAGAVITPAGKVLFVERPIWRAVVSAFSDSTVEPLRVFKSHKCVLVEHRDGDPQHLPYESVPACWPHFIQSNCPCIIVSDAGELVAVRNITDTSFLKALWRHAGDVALPQFHKTWAVLVVDTCPAATFEPTILRNLTVARERFQRCATAAFLVPRAADGSPPVSPLAAAAAESTTSVRSAPSANSASQPSAVGARNGRFCLIDGDPRYVPSALSPAIIDIAERAWVAAESEQASCRSAPLSAATPTAQAPPSSANRAPAGVQAECPVCFEGFADDESKRPVLCLGCGQSFCRGCHSRVLRCPMCREAINREKAPVTNVALLQLLSGVE